MLLKRSISGPMVVAFVLLATIPASAQQMHGGHDMGAQTQSGHAMDMQSGDDMGMQGGHAMGAAAADSGAGHAGHDAAAMQHMGNTSPRIHQLHIAGQQHVLAHAATIHALLAALDIDREENLDSLRRTRDLFQRMLIGLRDGDREFGIVGFENPEILARMVDVEIAWRQYDQLVDRVLEGSADTAGDVTALAAVSPRLHEALHRMVLTVEHQGRSFSILVPTVRQAGNLHTELQSLLVNYLIAVSDDDTDMAGVHNSAAGFERVLQAMVDGDSDLHVLPAPTLELASRYAEIHRRWRQCWSDISTMPPHDRGLPDAIATVRGHIDVIADEVVEVVSLYHFL